jgi:hypothetical protein
MAPQKSSQRSEKSAAEFLAEKWPNFLKCIIHIKALINGRKRLFNTLINPTFLLFWPEAGLCIRIDLNPDPAF